MWTSYLFTYIWLTGSVRVPLMALVCLAGKKWKRLYFLTSSRKRWLLVWGCLSLLETMTIAGLLLVLARSFVFPGWAGRAAWSALDATRLNTAPMLLEFMIGFLFAAIGEVTMGVLFAALVWWILRLYPKTEQSPVAIESTERYAVALVASVCALGIANRIYSMRPPTCYDCSERHGIPFPYFQEAPWGIGQGFIWSGVIGDSLVVIALGMVVGWIWNRMSRGHAIKAADF